MWCLLDRTGLMKLSVAPESIRACVAAWRFADFIFTVAFMERFLGMKTSCEYTARSIAASFGSTENPLRVSSFPEPILRAVHQRSGPHGPLDLRYLAH